MGEQFDARLAVRVERIASERSPFYFFSIMCVYNRYSSTLFCVLMVSTLDVFAVNDDKPRWVGSTETLEKALELAIQHGDGLYFVFSQETGRKNVFAVTSGKIFPVDS